MGIRPDNNTWDSEAVAREKMFLDTPASTNNAYGKNRQKNSPYHFFIKTKDELSKEKENED